MVLCVYRWGGQRYDSMVLVLIMAPDEEQRLLPLSRKTARQPWAVRSAFLPQHGADGCVSLPVFCSLFLRALFEFPFSFFDPPPSRVSSSLVGFRERRSNYQSNLEPSSTAFAVNNLKDE